MFIYSDNLLFFKKTIFGIFLPFLVKFKKEALFSSVMPGGLQGLVERKTLAIFTSLSGNPSKLFHLNSLASGAKVPVSSTARIIKRLVSSGFAEELKIGKISVYKIAAHEKVRTLKEVNDKKIT